MQKHQRCVLEGPKHAKSFSLPAAKFLPRCGACPGAVRAQDRDRSCAGQCWGGWRSRRTNLGVGAVLLLALPTGEEVGLRPSCLGHLMLPDRFFRHGFPDLFQLVTGHFLSKKKKKKAIKSHLPSFTSTPAAGEGTKGTEGAYRWLLSQEAFRFWLLARV